MADDNLEPSKNAREWIDLKIGSLRQEMRLLFVVSVAGNQLLTHLSLNPTIGYVGNGAVIVGVVAAKLFWAA